MRTVPVHIIERGVERGSPQRSSLRGWERAVVSQTNIGTVSKATLGKLLETGWSSYGLSRAHIYHLQLNGTHYSFVLIILKFEQFLHASNNIWQWKGGTSFLCCLPDQYEYCFFHFFWRWFGVQVLDLWIIAECVSVLLYARTGEEWNSMCCGSLH